MSRYKSVCSFILLLKTQQKNLEVKALSKFQALTFHVECLTLSMFFQLIISFLTWVFIGHIACNSDSQALAVFGQADDKRLHLFLLRVLCKDYQQVNTQCQSSRKDWLIGPMWEHFRLRSLVTTVLFLATWLMRRIQNDHSCRESCKWMCPVKAVECFVNVACESQVIFNSVFCLFFLSAPETCRRLRTKDLEKTMLVHVNDSSFKIHY